MAYTKPQINYNGITVYGVKNYEKMNEINCKLLKILIEHSTKPIYVQFFSDEIVEENGTEKYALLADFVVE